MRELSALIILMFVVPAFIAWLMWPSGNGNKVEKIDRRKGQRRKRVRAGARERRVNSRRQNPR